MATLKPSLSHSLLEEKVVELCGTSEPKAGRTATAGPPPVPVVSWGRSKHRGYGRFMVGISCIIMDYHGTNYV